MELERKIEKLLRAYAKKRRADAGDAFTLHPVTRRRLQGEVARRSAEPEEEDSVSLWELFRRQWAVLVGFALIIFLGSALFLPALSKEKFKSQKVVAMSNLKQIGVAAQMAAADNNGRLPATLATLTNGLGSDKILTDPESGKRFVYAAGGQTLDELRSNDVLAYSPEDKKGRAVLFADGSVQRFGREKFSELTNRGRPEIALAENRLRREQTKELSDAVAPSSAPAPAVVPPVAGEFAGIGGSMNGVAAQSLASAKPATTATGTLTVNNGNVHSFLARGSGAAGSGDQLSYGLRADSAASPAVVSGNKWGLKSDTSGAVAGLPAATAPAVASATVSETGSSAVAQNSLYFKSLAQSNAAQFALNNNSQRFIQTAAVAAKTPPVLASFEFQQNGSALAVVDRDGSVYNGTLQPVELALQDDLSKAKEPADRRAGDFETMQKDLGVVRNTLSPAQNYFFRVSGTNRSLKQNVVFAGNVITAARVTENVAQSFSNQISNGSAGQFQSANANASQAQALFSNSRIQGTATIDHTNQVEINAVPVAP